MIPYYYREKSRINVVGDEKDMNLKNVKNIDGTIKEILSIKYHYEIDDVVSSRDLEELLNYYLTLVRDTFIIIIYHYICTRVIEYKED